MIIVTRAEAQDEPPGIWGHGPGKHRGVKCRRDKLQALEFPIAGWMLG
jgi:hypothetical protein